MSEASPLGITDVVLRDAHQSLFATRLRLDDMLPITEKLDQVGFWSLESWGGATFDACIRFLGEDPWERIRELKKAMPNTPQQMLFRAQNILGYRHYADDIVDKFVERAAINGVDVFRVFDAMNDARNLETAIKAVNKQGKHAQGTLSYTVSPVHNIQSWLDLGKRLEAMGAHSIAIKDMAGLLSPYVAFELISELKKAVQVPIHMQCHATTGMSTATYLKSIEAGIDNVDTAISSMSMTYGHSPTEALVAILKDSERDTGLDIDLLEEIAAYFREVRKKYAKFEGSLKGIDSRILVAQVPGGMLTNLENQLREQNATDRLDEVLLEIPKVREELGFIPLVTPTSQIVGTQAVLNVLTGERYKNITKETEGVLKGEYGAAPAPVDKELQARVLDGAEAVTCRPADLLEPEFDRLKAELLALEAEKNLQFGESIEDDVLTYALFPQPGLKFLANRNNPEAFEPHPNNEPASPQATAAKHAAGEGGAEVYSVEVQGEQFVVKVSPGGDVQSATPVASPAISTGGVGITAPLSGNVFKIHVAPGDQVKSGDVVVVLEAMKMETEIRATNAGQVGEVLVREGDSVSASDTLITLV
ncbi:MAG TPA: sodium-extruding oxaloacetate decarboxylase subunit alpha [Pseudomonadales bacterium]|jgi:oxaloacetate decarboxylase alpha subunit|nr:oxaloacetate decarboxylase subunit alpha [Gammaproteobacteria bacterium]MDP6024428.1 sodium-extruding oxaloacetate decarboxylase subunit alpha [Pseudomonadales bacterium]MDP7452300.1 sodium-extruding oxaloacetate decarboxylase subunit alpha [Arenicellales bacterium]MDP7315678.1 sodium-extruding oxaloacetate decarboxylase subunit alpha [Pseudomonadales bacterium]HJL61323.1 sodium-extruding oxaloacetate decarboxylase subunit alpha [Pseudomonadales bacterium]|tara:strand:- start:831 stop:2603 length:1773 start_codon:yes stop_codon:yes gene_type:complete